MREKFLNSKWWGNQFQSIYQFNLTCWFSLSKGWRGGAPSVDWLSLCWDWWWEWSMNETFSHGSSQATSCWASTVSIWPSWPTTKPCLCWRLRRLRPRWFYESSRPSPTARRRTRRSARRTSSTTLTTNERTLTAGRPCGLTGWVYQGGAVFKCVWSLQLDLVCFDVKIHSGCFFKHLVTCTGAETSSCRRSTTRAGASASSEAMRRAMGSSSLSSLKPSCLVLPLTSMDASSESALVTQSSPAF